MKINSKVPYNVNMMKFYYDKTTASLIILFKSQEAGSMLDDIKGIAGHKKTEIPHITNTRWSDSLYPRYGTLCLTDCCMLEMKMHFPLPTGHNVSCNTNSFLICTTRNYSYFSCVAPSNTTAERNQLTWHVLCNSGIRSNNSPNLEGISG
jgi:hypothetical protein